MASREIEARLKISAVDRASKVLRGIGSTLDQIDRKAGAMAQVDRQMTRMQMAERRVSTAANSATTALVGPGGMLAGLVGLGAVKTVITDFAVLERRLTQLGVTADASGAEIRTAFADVRKLADDVALPVDQVLGGLEGLVAAGMSLGEAMVILPAIAKTAQAAGADVLDIANSAEMVGRSFGIAGQDMQKVLDALVFGGKAGKFELQDMARYIPTLAPQMATLGYAGLDGLEDMIVALQVVRATTGTAEEAATRFGDVVGKIYSPEVARQFKKFGIDLPKALDKARREGDDLLEVFLDLAEEAVDGDFAKLSSIIGDKEARLGLLALLQARDETRRLKAEIQGAAGAVENDLNRKLGDTISKLTQMNDLAATVGNNAATRFKPAIDASLDLVNAQLRLYATLLDDPMEALKQINGVRNELVTGVVAAVDPDLVPHRPDAQMTAIGADYKAALDSARRQSGTLDAAAAAKARIEADTSLSPAERRQRLADADREIETAAADLANALQAVDDFAAKLKDIAASMAPWPDEGARRLAAERVGNATGLPMARPADMVPSGRTFSPDLGALPSMPFPAAGDVTPALHGAWTLGASVGQLGGPAVENMNALFSDRVGEIGEGIGGRLETAFLAAQDEAAGLESVLDGLNLADPIRSAFAAMIAEQGAALTTLEGNFRASMRRLAASAAVASPSGGSPGVRVNTGESMPNN